jgi:hypothetical protein
VLARENLRDCRVLKGPELAPAQAVRDVMLQGGMEAIEVAHWSSSTSSTSDEPIA